MTTIWETMNLNSRCDLENTERRGYCKTCTIKTKSCKVSKVPRNQASQSKLTQEKNGRVFWIKGWNYITVKIKFSYHKQACILLHRRFKEGISRMGHTFEASAKDKTNCLIPSLWDHFRLEGPRRICERFSLTEKSWSARQLIGGDEERNLVPKDSI